MRYVLSVLEWIFFFVVIFAIWELPPDKFVIVVIATPALAVVAHFLGIEKDEE